MFKRKKREWEKMPSSTFIDESEGEGEELLLIDTKYVRVRLQRFLVGSVVVFHKHPHELEIVLRLGWGILLAIYPPNMEHCLFGPPDPKNDWWTSISIKIGKRP